jgi:hypothetical protein
VQDPSQLRIPSPDGKSLAILRRSVLSAGPHQPIPIDQLFIEPVASRKVIVQPAFVVKWKYQQQYKIEWLSSTELRVTYPAEAEILTREPTSGAVTILYAPQSGAPKSDA